MIRDFSQRSRNNMRWELAGLDWASLGDRPIMLSLTYPGDWRVWAPDGPQVRRHVERFKERWRRRWGEPIRGFWVREFQTRGAPHFHLYVALPAGVSADEYVALSDRTQRRKWMERSIGKYRARRECGLLREVGEFSRWVLRAWAESVGTGQLSEHRKFGVDVAAMFWANSTAEFAARQEQTWVRVGEYLWRESGKWGQKTVPDGFDRPGRSWGRWGVGLRVSTAELDDRQWFDLRRMLLRYVAGKRGRPLSVRGRDGLTAFGLVQDDVLRLLRLAEDLAAAKSAGQYRVRLSESQRARLASRWLERERRREQAAFEAWSSGHYV